MARLRAIVGDADDEHHGVRRAYTSPGTGWQIHNTFTAELSPTDFVTDHIALDLASGIPPGSHVESSLSPSWNPAFNAGASYTFSKNWYATASVTYLPLKTNATVTAYAANGQPALTNKTRITVNPWIAFVGVGYRF
ncbi:hypothetical protein M3I54_01095 [Paraburkholderia sp. CNPSo 3274]|uniref:OmpW family outer membrane protein n=1 Tax=Paraburkholderia sp. CNPSo 3274 TaxID=2940932 RepID=UPI0020B84E9B|nr:OmpW family outer membrane protein [Paraburkholderia sp. CNPSo 3274]MCP3705600.1 hypothetical protein [Paraburkholderia sp. CNPSo 3274]